MAYNRDLPRTGTVGCFGHEGYATGTATWVIYLGLSETVWLYVRRPGLDPYTHISAY